VDGVCSLRVRNEMPEVHYIDALKLLAVDHEAGVVVAPEFGGALHALRSLRDPRRAEDAAGVNIREQVARKDGRMWLSNPFNRDAEASGGSRDGLTAEFDRPDGAASARLLFTVRNTDWAADAEAYLAELAGSRLADWRAFMDAWAPARLSFLTALTREAALDVRVWSGSDWVPGGTIWFVGPSLSKDIVVPLDLRDIGAGPLRVKLESTAGLWMVDRIQADFGTEAPFTVADCVPLEGRDAEGADVRARLGASDGDYLVLSSPADRADLAFREPPRSPGRERSFILMTEGYYLGNGNPAAEPQMETLAGLLQPGAMGRHMLKRLNEALGRALAAPAAAVPPHLPVRL
jgi:hypothetical protein